MIQIGKNKKSMKEVTTVEALEYILKQAENVSAEMSVIDFLGRNVYLKKQVDSSRKIEMVFCFDKSGEVLESIYINEYEPEVSWKLKK